MTQQSERFYELTAWLRGIGCCNTCGLRIAIAAVVREEHEHWCEPPQIACAAPVHRRGRCDEIAKLRWPERPQRRFAFTADERGRGVNEGAGRCAPMIRAMLIEDASPQTSDKEMNRG